MTIENPLAASEFVHALTIESLPNGLVLFTFPDRFRLYSHTCVEETEFIYNEIVVKQEYLQHGLSLEDASCVFDVGANIGVYTIFAKLCNPAVYVYSFEPIAETYDVLRKNIALWGMSGVEVLNIAVGDEDYSEKQLVYYPHAAGNSTAYPEIQETEQKQKALVEIFGEEKTKWFFESEKRTATVRTLSSIMNDYQISSIDMLKIDVEGEEVAVLQGIQAEHQHIIKQIAIEVHSAQIMKKVILRLEEMGFRIVSDTGIAGFVGTTDVFAVRG